MASEPPDGLTVTELLDYFSMQEAHAINFLLRKAQHIRNKADYDKAAVHDLLTEFKQRWEFVIGWGPYIH